MSREMDIINCAKNLCKCRKLANETLFEFSTSKRFDKELLEKLATLYNESTATYNELEKAVDEYNNLLDIKISDVGFSPRIMKCLSSLKNPNRFVKIDMKEPETLGDLSKFSEAELLRIRNLGRKSLNDIKFTLHKYGLRLEIKEKIGEY